MSDLSRTSVTTTKKETWTTKAKHIKLTGPVEITRTETIRCCTRLDHTKNEDIWKTLKIELVQNKVDK